MSEQENENPQVGGEPDVPQDEAPEVAQEPDVPEAPPAPGDEYEPPLSDPDGAAQERNPLEPESA